MIYTKQDEWRIVELGHADMCFNFGEKNMELLEEYYKQQLIDNKRYSYKLIYNPCYPKIQKIWELEIRHRQLKKKEYYCHIFSMLQKEDGTPWEGGEGTPVRAFEIFRKQKTDLDANGLRTTYRDKTKGDIERNPKLKGLFLRLTEAVEKLKRGEEL